MRSTLVISAVLVGILFAPVAHARDVEDCKTRWGSAVRSYLTKNQRAGPTGKVPANLDEMEIEAMAWVSMFGAACALEAKGKKRKARLEAATKGTATLAKLDPVACQRFLHYFMKAKDPKSVCRLALDEPDRMPAYLAAKLKHRRRLTAPWPGH